MRAKSVFHPTEFLHLRTSFYPGEPQQAWAKGWGQKKTALGNGRLMPCADDVLLSCTLETHMVLQTNATPIQSIKK